MGSSASKNSPAGKPPTAEEAAKIVLTACKKAKRPEARVDNPVSTLFGSPALLATFVKQVVACSSGKGFTIASHKVKTGGTVGDVCGSVVTYAAATPVIHPSGEVAAKIVITACKNAKRPDATFDDPVSTPFPSPGLLATFVRQVVKCSLTQGFIMPRDKVNTDGSIGDVSDSVGKYAFAKANTDA